MVNSYTTYEQGQLGAAKGFCQTKKMGEAVYNGHSSYHGLSEF